MEEFIVLNFFWMCSTIGGEMSLFFHVPIRFCFNYTINFGYQEFLFFGTISEILYLFADWIIDADTLVYLGPVDFMFLVYGSMFPISVVCT